MLARWLRSRHAAFLLALFAALFVSYLHETRALLATGHRDFPSFYYAARAAFGEGRSPYDPAYLMSLGATRVFPFIYPPPALLLLAPLAVLPYELSKDVFLAFNLLLVLLLLFGTLFLVLHLRPESHAPAIGFAIVYVFTFHPLFVQLSHGQVNLLLAVLMVLVWLALQRDWARVAGLALGLAVVLKTYPILLLGFLVIQRRWRVTGWTLAVVVVLCGLSYAVLPPLVWNDWLRDVAPASGYGPFETAGSARALKWPGGVMSPSGVENQSVNGVLSRMFTENKVHEPIVEMPQLGTSFTYLVNIVLVLSSAWVVFAAWRRRVCNTDGLMVLTLLLMYLIAPISWEHHLVYLLPAILALGIWVLELESFRRTAFLLWLSASILLAAPFLLRIKFVGVLAMWVLAMFVIAIRTRQEPRQPAHELADDVRTAELPDRSALDAGPSPTGAERWA